MGRQESPALHGWQQGRYGARGLLPAQGARSARGQEHAAVDEFLAVRHPQVEVDQEYRNGRPADRRAADEDRAVPAEVTPPLVAAGVEEAGQGAAPGIEAGDVGTFEGVAEGTNVRPTKMTGIDPPLRFP
jgi:hypothetical protein